MIFEQCTDNAINVTRICIKGLGYDGTHMLLIGLMILLIFLFIFIMFSPTKDDLDDKGAF